MQLDTRGYREVLESTVGQLPRTRSASDDARTRSGWRRALEALVEEGAEEAKHTHVALESKKLNAAQRAGNEITEHVANEIAKALKRALYRRARQLGMRHIGRSPVNRKWTKAARACART